MKKPSEEISFGFFSNYKNSYSTWPAIAELCIFR